MKRLAFAILTAFATLAAFAGSGNITIDWTYSGATNTAHVFKLYESASVATPMTNWNVIAILPGTNRTYTLSVTPGPHYFAMTASNFWGEIPFSNVAATPCALDSNAPVCIDIHKAL